MNLNLELPNTTAKDGEGEDMAIGKMNLDLELPNTLEYGSHSQQARIFRHWD